MNLLTAKMTARKTLIFEFQIVRFMNMVVKEDYLTSGRVHTYYRLIPIA